MSLLMRMGSTLIVWTLVSGHSTFCVANADNRVHSGAETTGARPRPNAPHMERVVVTRPNRPVTLVSLAVVPGPRKISLDAFAKKFGLDIIEE